MPVHFCKRHLDRPAPHEPAQPITRIGRQIRVQESLRLERARFIPHQHPVDRHALARVGPQRRAGGDRQTPVLFCVPLCDSDLPPLGSRAGQALRQARLTSTRDPRRSLLSGRAHWGWIEQARIEPQAGDHHQVSPHRCEQLDGRIAHVSHHNDLLVRQPTGHLKQHLACPIRQHLVPPLASIAFRVRQDGEERQGSHVTVPGD